MITLHFAPLTRSIRIMWLLEELGLDYAPRHVAFRPGGGQDTPSGRFPVIEDGEITVLESGAIVEYLLESYGDGRLAPPIGSPHRARYLEWLHYAEATLAVPINAYVWLAVYRDDAADNARLIAIYRESAQQNFSRIEVALGDDDYLVANTFSAADVMIGFTLWSAKMLGLPTEAHPNTLAYYRRPTARPAFAKALAESRRASASFDQSQDVIG